MNGQWGHVSGFGGLVTSVDRAMVPANQATDGFNYLCDDGSLKPRRGFRNLADAPANFDGIKGLQYVSGYDSSNAEAEEFITFEKRAGVATYKPYRLETATWTRTEIKNVAASLTLSASEWYAVCCKGIAYCFNDTDGLYKHVVGTTNTFSPLVMPPTPTERAGWMRVGNGKIELAGIDPSAAGEVACTGKASNINSSFVDPVINIRHSTGVGAASIEIDLDGTTAGKRDWYWNDAFSFLMATRSIALMDFEPSNIKVTLTSDGADVVTGTVTTKRLSAASTMTQVLVWWDQGKVRADWGDGAGAGHTEKIKIEYTISSAAHSGTGSANSEVGFFFGILANLGWTRTLPANVANLTNQTLSVAYSYYDSTTQLESDLSPIAEIPYSEFYLPDPENVQYHHVGARMNITFPATASADKTRIYVKDLNDLWRRVATVDDTSSPYVYYVPYIDLIDYDTYSARQFETTGKVVCATEFKGSVVWGYKGGYQNIRYSRTDSAEGQASLYDELDDDARGGTYSMSENFDDEPRSMWSFADSLLMLGQKGAYWQTGDRPSNMSPIARVPGSQGVAGRRAAARWPFGVAYMTSSGDVRSVSGNVGGFQEEEVSGLIRGFAKLYLADQQGLSLANVVALYDERTDALWFTLGVRALVLRKPNVADGKRHWHPQQYAHTISYASGTPKHGIVWIRSTGQADQSDYNTATGAFVEGVARDGGAVMLPGKWVGGMVGSKVGRTRINRFELDYDGTAVLTVHSERQTSTPLVFNGQKHVKCGAFQQGWSHYVEVTMDENLTRLESFSPEVIPMSVGRNA